MSLDCIAFDSCSGCDDSDRLLENEAAEIGSTSAKDETLQRGSTSFTMKDGISATLSDSSMKMKNSVRINKPADADDYTVPSREVNYDAIPTELYQAIEAKQFDYARLLLEDNSPEQLNDPSILSGYEQANTWICRKNEDDDEIRWRMLPLHAAIIFKAPSDIIETLMALSPMSIKLKDDTGKLPIHLAFAKGAEKMVIVQLLNAYPQSVMVQDRKGRVPHECSKDNKLELLNDYTNKRLEMEKHKLLTEFQERRDREMKKYKKKLDAQIEDLKSSYEKKINMLMSVQQKMEQAIEDSRDESIKSHEERLRELDQIYQEKLRSLKASKANEALTKILDIHTTQRKDAETKLVNLHSQIDEIKNQLNDSRVKMNQQLAETHEEINPLEERRDELEQEIEDMEEQIENVTHKKEIGDRITSAMEAQVQDIKEKTEPLEEYSQFTGKGTEVGTKVKVNAE